MDEINDQLDVISERLLTLDGEPLFDPLKKSQTHTKIKDWPGNFDKTTPERLAHLVAGYRYLEDLYQHGIEVTDIEKIILPKISSLVLRRQLKRKIWMLQAELDQAPEIDN